MEKTNEAVTSTYDPYDVFTKEELEEVELVEVNLISKEQCKDKNINISLIALNELEKIGFKKSMEVYLLSKLIEEVYHERVAFNSTDYFDLSKPDNKHYTKLVDYYKVGNEKLYRGLIAKAIGDSNCETKNINDIVYGIVKTISCSLENNQLLKLEA